MLTITVMLGRTAGGKQRCVVDAVTWALPPRPALRQGLSTAPRLTFSVHKRLLHSICDNKHELLGPGCLLRCLESCEALPVCQRQQPQAHDLLQPGAVGASGEIQILQAVRKQGHKLLLPAELQDAVRVGLGGAAGG